MTANTWEKAFGQDASGVAPNFWSPEAQEQRRIRQEQEAQRLLEEAAAQAEEQRQRSLQYVGPALMGIVQRYAHQNAPAVAEEVEKEFRAKFPGASSADFRRTLEELKADGKLYEFVSSTQGFMGARTSHLHILEN